MQIRCKVCKSEFGVGDEIVRVLRARNGTIPCRKCRTPISLAETTASDKPTESAATETTPAPAPAAKTASKPAPDAPKPSAAPAKPGGTQGSIWRPAPKPVVAHGSARSAPPAPRVARAAAAHPAAEDKPKPPPLPHASSSPLSHPPPLPHHKPIHHEKPGNTPHLPAPTGARASAHAPAPVTEVPSEWMVAEPEEAVDSERPTLTPGAPVEPAAAQLAPEKATPPPVEPAPAPKAAVSPPPLPLPSVEPPALSPDPPAVAPTSDPPPHDASADAPPIPPPLPEPARESPIPTIAAAASAITIPATAETTSDDTFARPQRPKGIRIAAAAAALFGAVAAWSGLRALSTPQQPAQAATAPPKAPVAAAPIASASISQAETPPHADPPPAPAAEPESPPPQAIIEPAPAPTPERPRGATTPVAQQDDSSGDTHVAKKTAPPIAAPHPAAPTTARAEKPPETDLDQIPARASKPTIDDDALQQALAQAAQVAKRCHVEGGPTGTVRVSVTLAPSGDVTGVSVSGAAFTNTVEGDCIAAKFRGIHVPAFSGGDYVARKSVTIE